MSIPVNISTELASLQGQVAAATPLKNASSATLKALQLNATDLVSDIQAVLTAENRLDTWVAAPDAATIVAGFNLSVEASDDQQKLSLLRGVVGRVTSNLDQLV